jgi:hypothetical protein
MGLKANQTRDQGLGAQAHVVRLGVAWSHSHALVYHGVVEVHGDDPGRAEESQKPLEVVWPQLVTW